VQRRDLTGDRAGDVAGRTGLAGNADRSPCGQGQRERYIADGLVPGDELVESVLRRLDGAARGRNVEAQP